MLQNGQLHTWHIRSRWSGNWHCRRNFVGSCTHAHQKPICKNLLLDQLVNLSSHRTLVCSAIMLFAIMQTKQRGTILGYSKICRVIYYTLLTAVCKISGQSVIRHFVWLTELFSDMSLAPVHACSIACHKTQLVSNSLKS